MNTSNDITKNLKPNLRVVENTVLAPTEIQTALKAVFVVPGYWGRSKPTQALPGKATIKFGQRKGAPVEMQLIKPWLELHKWLQTGNAPGGWQLQLYPSETSDGSVYMRSITANERSRRPGVLKSTGNDMTGSSFYWTYKTNISGRHAFLNEFPETPARNLVSAHYHFLLDGTIRIVIDNQDCRFTPVLKVARLRADFEQAQQAVIVAKEALDQAFHHQISLGNDLLKLVIPVPKKIETHEVDQEPASDQISDDGFAERPKVEL